MRLLGLVCFALASTMVVAQPAAQLAALPAPRPEPSKPEARAAAEPAALEWLKANITPFAVDVPTQAELKPLMDQLQGSRVIGFGEATHGDQQSQLFKTHAIRELVRLGRIDTLMLELNRRAGADLDAYVNEGKGDLTRLMLESGIFTIWRTDEFAALITWLRAHVIRSGKPFRIFGIDCQEPGIDFDVALQWLQRVDRRTARRLAPILKPLYDAEQGSSRYFMWLRTQTREDYKRYHAAGKDLIAAIEKQAGKPGQTDALYAARVGVQGLESFELEFRSDDLKPGEAPTGYFARRDIFMGANLLARLGDGRAALWAHDMHTLGEVPALYKIGGFRTVGSEVRDQLKDKYVAVGFAWSSGAFRARRCTAQDQIVVAAERPFEIFPASCMRPGDLGEFLNRVGPDRWYVDFRTANEATKTWGKLMYYRGWCGWAFDPDAWLQNPFEDSAPTLPTHDILVYHRTIGPSTFWMLPASPTANR